MDKLVQYVEWNLPNVMPNKMYHIKMMFGTSKLY